VAIHPDFRDLLEVFEGHAVEYLLIGGYAVAFHARPRFTEDLDIWIGTDPTNVDRVARALAVFGAPDNVVEALREAKADEIVFLGAPPVRIELFKTIPGVEFVAAYRRRAVIDWDGVRVSIIGRDDLVTAKRAVSRPQDLLDLESLTADS
jgi:hypothetical protein